MQSDRDIQYNTIQYNTIQYEYKRLRTNVRIHVEQVIGNLKNKYSTLNGTLPIDYLLSKGNDTEKLITLDRTVHVACALINLCPSVVPYE